MRISLPVALLLTVTLPPGIPAWANGFEQTDMADAPPQIMNVASAVSVPSPRPLPLRGTEVPDGEGDKVSRYASFTLNGINMRFAPIPAGEFVMGNSHADEAVFELPDGDANLIRDELPAHRVRITRGFLLGQTEVTQSQWQELMKNRPGPAQYWWRADWADLPVVGVSWRDVQAFIARLNARERTRIYRLPSEAEWEYAARAGSSGLRPFARNELTDYAWYQDNSGDEPHPVATRAPNAWGLYDMLGNAWEWVADRYAPDYYRSSSGIDPRGPLRGEQRVRRGGSYHCPPHQVRPGYRAADTPDTRYSVLGFRVLREGAANNP
jgi:formylglycine-generating enzyme required for sulfatase activity